MKILVLGCGSIGKRHAMNLCQHGNVGIFDADLTKAKALGVALGAKVFVTIEDAIQWRPDAAVVATPHDTHISLSIKLVQARIPLLIEKPISDRIDGVDSLLELASRMGVSIYVACNMRYHPGVSELKRNLKKIGNIYFARAQYGSYLPEMRIDADYRNLYCSKKEMGGGVVLDAIHEVDYIIWLMGDVVDIKGCADKLSPMEINVEDYAALYFLHKNGMRSEIHLDYLQRFKRRGCEIVGSHGTLIWNSEGKNPEQCTVKLYQAATCSWEVVYHSVNVDGNEPYIKLIEDFLNVIEGSQSDTLLTGAHARRNLEVTLQAKSQAGF
jgi:predicted dehydrogenase